MVNTSGENGESSDEPQFKKPRLPIKSEVAHDGKAGVLKYEDVYLRAIPSASQYEKSFMHRQTITHVIATVTNFILTASVDGHLKFWKKKHAEGVEFVKHFKCHMNGFSDLAVNYNGTLLATISADDKTAKIFDITNFDMINILTLNFRPAAIAWVSQGSDIVHSLAIADLDSPAIHVYDGKGNELLHTIKGVHFKPVTKIDYNAKIDMAISIDSIGMIEFWSGSKGSYEFPEEKLNWSSKMDTDLYEYAKMQSSPHCLKIAPDGLTFATYGTDRLIRIFDIKSGKIVKTINETLQNYVDQAKENKNFGLPSIIWSRIVAQEKELNKDPTSFQFLNMCYDLTGNFLIYPSPLGIRVYNLVTDKVVREIGKGENIRFLSATLCRAVPDSRELLGGASTNADIEVAENPNLKKSEPDPMIIASGHKKNRFYIFTNMEPYSTDQEEDESTNRDVFNEKPVKEDILTAIEGDTPRAQLCEHATIHTTFGDIAVELFPDKCPKGVENFCVHSRRGYYNGHTFHRVIKSFMIQTGDPSGRGTGGESIWGNDFEDEFHPSLKHDKPYRLSYANAGPNTNGSQWFITVVPTEWLDGKNTIFGHVTEGFDVVQKINTVQTHGKTNRPLDDIQIVSISLL